MLYHVAIRPNGAGGFIAQGVEVSEAVTEGATRSEAIANAADAIEVALLGLVKDGLPIPAPTGDASGDPVVHLAASTTAKLAFYEAFRQSGLSRVALASKLGKDEAEVRRMLDPYHATKLPALEAGLRALGKRLSLVVEDA